jgi:hypothetical protein
MGIVSFFRRLGERMQPERLETWFFVSFDAVTVRIRAGPPGQEPWAQEFPWSSIVRVCFQAEDFEVSDGVYVFTSLRPESFVIPTEANGGSEFWGEVLRRKLFDAELATQAASATNQLFCWPRET